MSQGNLDTSLESWRNQLAQWLDSEDWQIEQLLRWLQGHDLPFVRHDEEPYIWLLRGLPPGGDRFQAEKKLAVRIALILAKRPDVQQLGKQPEKLLYNLLMLCAGLACAQELAVPLYEMFERRELAGNWRGVNLCGRLRDALIENQIDNRLEPIWLAILDQKGDFLPGNIYDALEGIRLIPPNNEKPVLGSIGIALKALAEYIEPEQDRRPKLRKYIRKIIDTYPGRQTWNLDLIWQADKHQWPEWAVECLPSLCIPLGFNPEGQQTLYIWQPIIQVIPQELYVKQEALCNQLVFKVHVTEQAMKLIYRIAPAFEQKRYSNPWPSDRAGKAVKIDIMSYLDLEMGGKGSRKARPYREARKRLLVQNNLSLGASTGRSSR